MELDRDPLWYKDAVVYETHVKAFFDGNGDGVGDLEGLIEKLDSWGRPTGAGSPS